jgi:hypothetical protein
MALLSREIYFLGIGHIEINSQEFNADVITVNIPQ